MANGTTADPHGRGASRPTDIPAPGWKDILLRTKRSVTRDSISLVSAGVAFYLMLAVFPAIAATISIYGLVADPADVERQIQSLMGVMPPQAAQILQGQMRSVVSASGAGLSIGAIGGILFSLWSTAKGVKAMMNGLNMAYHEEERRGFIKLNAVALMLTVGAVLFLILALALVAVLPPVLERWPLLVGGLIVALAVLYRYGPSRDNPQWQWTSAGAISASVMWLIASVLFSIYVSNFGSYNKTYGSVGAVVVLMMWFFISSFVILLGAEINSEMERQTRQDTTEGEPKPMGARGAHAADTVGREPPP
jgi:membrane protein